MEDDEWMDLDVRANATIILCLTNEILYNVTNEKTTASLWCKLESLHDVEFIQQTLLEEAVLQSPNEGRNTGSAES